MLGNEVKIQQIGGNRKRYREGLEVPLHALSSKLVLHTIFYVFCDVYSGSWSMNHGLDLVVNSDVWVKDKLIRLFHNIFTR